MRVYLAFSLLGFAFGACPNSCSSRGICGSDDVCECFAGWRGGDCSYRICPFGPSWTVSNAEDYADDRDRADKVLRTPGGYLHTKVDGTYDLAQTYDDIYPKVPAFRPYTECSSRGNCNYATGVCNCFAGYEGRGCRRTACPNKCSGHGKCMLNKEVGMYAYHSVNKYNSQFWDQGRSQQCVCDRGFNGFDCSQRICAYGDNPSSACQEGSADDFQLVYMSTDKDDFFTLTMRDMFGGTYTTRPINAQKCTTAGSCNEVQYALMELPNFAVPEVEVDLLDLGLAAKEKAFLIHFRDVANAGKQNTLGCEQVASPNVDGAAPKYKPVVACRVFHAGVPEWYNPDKTLKTFELNGKAVTQAKVLSAETLLHGLGAGAQDVLKEMKYKEFIPCSGRGTCNTDTGVCKCGAGAAGQGCRVSTIFS